MNVVLFIDLQERRLTIKYLKNNSGRHLESFDDNFFGDLDRILERHQDYRKAYITQLPTGDLGNPYGYSSYAPPVTGELDQPSSIVNLSEWVPEIRQEIRNINWNGEISIFLLNTLDDWQVPHDVPIRVVVNTSRKNLLLLPFEELNPISRRTESILLAHMTEASRKTSKASISNPIFRKSALLVMGCVDRVIAPLTKKEIIDYFNDGFSVEILKPIDNNNFIKRIRSGDYNTIILIGHSRASSPGQPSGFQIDSNTWISLEDFRSPFHDAVRKGLEVVLCIGCESIDLAEILHEIKVPNVIGFRYPVHSEVIRRIFESLQYFWIIENKSLEIAFKETRENLIDLDRNFPGTSISPVLLSLPFYPPVKFSQFIAWKARFRSWLDRQLSRLSRWIATHPRRVRFIGGLLVLISGLLIILLANRLIDSETPKSGLAETDICSQVGIQKDNYISCGNTSFLGLGDLTQDKMDGNKYFQEKKYAKAQLEFNQDWQNNHDPESLIYMLNAGLEIDKAPQDRILVAAVIIPAGFQTQEIAKSMLMGAAYAQNQWNNSQEKWKLKLIIINDRNDRKQNRQATQNSKQNGQAIQVANQLKQISDRSSTPILGAIGPYSTKLVKVVKDIYAQNHIPMISGTANGESIAGDYFFQTIQSNENDTQKIIELLKQGKYSANQIAVFFTSNNKKYRSDRSYSQLMIDRIKNDLKLPPNRIFDLENQTTFFKGSISNLVKKENVKVFILLPDAFTEWKTKGKLENFLDNYQKISGSPIKIVANSVVYNNDTFNYIQERSISIDNFIFVLPVDPSPNRKKNDIYNLYNLNYNQRLTVDWRIIPTADAAKILIQAIDLAVKEHPDYQITGANVREQLAKKDASFQTIGGMLKFEGNKPSSKNKIVSAITYKCSEGQCKPQK
jgi:ABC-type branched-subunit amino acid transport system substrate-binding protein